MYGWGVFFAVLAGVAANLGQLLNKREVNRLADPPGAPRAPGAPGGSGRGFYARLLRRPVWVAGVVLQIGVGTAFFLLAQVYVGPVLVPGLMATGLVALALGCAWITQEAPRLRELAGMACLIVSAVGFGRSGLRVDLAVYDVLSPAFLLRSAAFSLACCLLLAAALRLKGRSAGLRRGSLLALASGLLYVLSDFWVGPFTGSVLRLLGRVRAAGGSDPLAPLLTLFAFGSAVLVLTNLFGIALMQRAFQVASAAVAVPLQTIPGRLAPAAVYLLVFRLPPPKPLALPLFAAAVSLVIAATFLFAGRWGRGRGAYTPSGGATGRFAAGGPLESRGNARRSGRASPR